MTYDIFKNDIEREDAAKRLPELEQHPGWKYVARALDINLAHLEDELSNRRDYRNVDEIYTTLDRINDLRKFKQLPKLLLEEIQLEPDEPEEDPDPFPQVPSAEDSQSN
jgi:hypothetical protein